MHAIVVHLGLIKGSRVRQVAQLREFIEREIPPGEPLVVAGDFNDWGARMRYAMNAMGLRDSSDLRGPRTLTYPSRLPVTQLDFIYGPPPRAGGLHGAARADLGAHVRPSAAGDRLRAIKIDSNCRAQCRMRLCRAISPRNSFTVRMLGC